VGVADVDPQNEVDGEGLVLGHLLALVGSEWELQVGRHVAQFSREDLAHARGIHLERGRRKVERVTRSTRTSTALPLPAYRIRSRS
jgi:hypothetical protein